VQEVAYVDTRTSAEQSEFESARSQVLAELQAAGLDDLLDDVDANLFAAAIDRRVPTDAQAGMTRMLDLGVPTAVFVGPTGAVD
jgi:hypothetical protein